MENHLFFVQANRIGNRTRVRLLRGLSSICGPDGVELARAEGDDSYVCSRGQLSPTREINGSNAASGKHVIDRFADRRPEFYDTLTEPTPTGPNAIENSLSNERPDFSLISGI